MGTGQRGIKSEKRHAQNMKEMGEWWWGEGRGRGSEAERGAVFIKCHDSSIRTSIVRGRRRGVRVGLGLSSRATASSPSTCARAYSASRASSSAVRFARERRASANCPRKNIYINTNQREGKKFCSPKAAYSPATARTTLSMRTFLRDQRMIWLYSTIKKPNQKESEIFLNKKRGRERAHRWKGLLWRPRPPC
jgi:hypothetical protein